LGGENGLEATMGTSGLMNTCLVSTFTHTKQTCHVDRHTDLTHLSARFSKSLQVVKLYFVLRTSMLTLGQSSVPINNLDTVEICGCSDRWIY
jgi:hypothetical protein